MTGMKDQVPLPADARTAPVSFTSVDVTAALSAYLVLLLVVPSSLTIAGLGTYGYPSLIWGLLLLLWWVLWHLQGIRPVREEPSDPIRVAFTLLVILVLVSFAAALLRGQPSDQISPAISALVRLASWSGVVLVALDGLTSREQMVPLVRRTAIIGAFLAMLGLAQSFTGQSFLDWISAFPGIQFSDDDTVSARGAFSRSAGTALHPLEHLTMLVGILPLAIACGVTRGFSGVMSRVGALWWVPAGLIVLSCFVSVTRSAIVGLAVAFLASLPFMSKRQRWVVSISGLAFALVVTAAVPRMLGTLVGLFAGASDDPSVQSRTGALERLPEFMASSPLVGAGFGTFLPRYYIFDNQWVLLLVEVGVIGTAAFAGLLMGGIWSAYRASHRFSDVQGKILGRASAASLLAFGTTYFLFDALSFPKSAGILFLTIGYSGALLRISRAESPTRRRGRSRLNSSTSG